MKSASSSSTPPHSSSPPPSFSFSPLPSQNSESKDSNPPKKRKADNTKDSSDENNFSTKKNSGNPLFKSTQDKPKSKPKLKEVEGHNWSTPIGYSPPPTTSPSSTSSTSSTISVIHKGNDISATLTLPAQVTKTPSDSNHPVNDEKMDL
jgi:hypothetical protein